MAALFAKAESAVLWQAAAILNIYYILQQLQFHTITTMEESVKHI